MRTSFLVDSDPATFARVARRARNLRPGGTEMTKPFFSEGQMQPEVTGIRFQNVVDYFLTTLILTSLTIKNAVNHSCLPNTLLTILTTTTKKKMFSLIRGYGFLTIYR
ncbi:hypothetical protein CEXT_534491 [Caerostris extrusa]|uniref:Uncharacterized protein n=1 Tax=Caerostris extrusa TaxID=172846 RepID=A0AAV4XY95_CAEEX|nr:hypothetical protein CEXT_534491 [Caerostris extrusa]